MPMLAIWLTWYWLRGLRPREAGDWRQEAGEESRETGDGRRETGIGASDDSS
jgi:hypothetical protein